MSDFRAPLYERYVSRFTDERAERGDHEVCSQRSWFESKYLPLLPSLRRDARILDLGCGGGNTLGLLAAAGFRHAEGVDVSAEQVELARARGCDAEVADALPCLRARPETYDAIFALDFIEHFSKTECITLFQAIFDALKPGGLLVLQTPNGQGLFAGQVIHGDLTHMTVFTPGSLTQGLRLAGFTSISCQEASPIPTSAVGVARLAAWSVVRTMAAATKRIASGKRQAIWTENFICHCHK